MNSRPESERWPTVCSIATAASVRLSRKRTSRRCLTSEAMYLDIAFVMVSASRRAGAARHDLLVQFLVDDLDRAVDLGIGHAELMRDQLHQEVDPLDEGRSTGYRAGRRGGLEQAFRRLGVFCERDLVHRVGAQAPGDAVDMVIDRLRAR